MNNDDKSTTSSADAIVILEQLCAVYIFLAMLLILDELVFKTRFVNRVFPHGSTAYIVLSHLMYPIKVLLNSI